MNTVLVPAFQLDNMDPKAPSADTVTSTNRRWIPRFFHNLNNSESLDEKVVDIALRSSAAPTYFPIYQGFVDGGVFANNPALCAITTALSAGTIPSPPPLFPLLLTPPFPSSLPLLRARFCPSLASV